MTTWVDEQRYKALIYAVQKAVEIMKSGRIEMARNMLEGVLLVVAKDDPQDVA